mgnify:CR=1 FL=1|tara:strand:- start:1937 stop:2548 length:612 start_codon:yes stop_codon:yes gene_type:complete
MNYKKPLVNKENRFSKAPPGYSLTQPPGKWAWEKPPQFTDPDSAVEALIKSVQRPEVEEAIVKMFAAGISIEEVVSTTTKLGFMEGKFTPDVAEIIQTPLTIYFMGLATEAGIHTTRVFNTKDGKPPRKEMLDDLTLLGIMRDRNPEMAEMVSGGMQKQMMQEMEAQKQLMGQSFLGSPEPPQQGMLPNMSEGPEDTEEGMLS